MVQLVASIMSQQAQERAAGGPFVLRQGFLLKRGRKSVAGLGLGFSGWDRRFFMLMSDGALNYYSERVLQLDPGTFRLNFTSQQVGWPPLGVQGCLGFRV